MNVLVRNTGGGYDVIRDVETIVPLHHSGRMELTGGPGTPHYVSINSVLRIEGAPPRG